MLILPCGRSRPPMPPVAGPRAAPAGGQRRPLGAGATTGAAGPRPAARPGARPPWAPARLPRPRAGAAAEAAPAASPWEAYLRPCRHLPQAPVEVIVDEAPRTLALPDVDFPRPYAATAALRQLPAAAAAAPVRQLVDAALGTCGALLLRGLPLAHGADFDAFSAALDLGRRTYLCNAVRRGRVGGVEDVKVAAARLVLPVHNECTNIAAPPKKILFFMQVPAEDGGESLLAPTAAVSAAIDPALADLVAAHGGLRYTTWYPSTAQRQAMPPGRMREIASTWDEVVGSDKAAAVGPFFAGLGLPWRWDGGGGVRTEVVRPALTAGPDGAPLWFNFLHAGSTLPLFEIALADGTPLPEDLRRTAAQARWPHTVGLRLRAGDLLVLDNTLAMHGRNSYRGGERLMLASMMAR